MSKPRLAVLISGGGTNLQAIIDAIAAKELNAEIVLVLSNRKKADGIIRAQNAGIQTAVLRFKRKEQARVDYDQQVAMAIKGASADLIVLAGWMHIFTPEFLPQFPQQVINLHPALPGQFAGTHSIERAFAAFEAGEISESGCMVHHVVPEVDAGPVIVQRSVPFINGDTLECFAERMHSAEHVLIVEAIRKITNREL